jgi:D-alanine-D-alanine ligase
MTKMTPWRFEYPTSVGILYYGGEAEDLLDTLITVKMITEALENRGHVVRTMEVGKKNWRKAVRISGEVVFNLVEDPTWELYVKVGEALERAGRAQVGHDLRSFRYAVRKAAFKRRMEKLGIATPAFRIFNRRTKINQIRGLEYPLIVKPSGQHAGIGISQDSVVIDVNELKERVLYLFKNFPGEVVVEEFVDGREIQITVLGNGRHIVALPYAGLEFKGEFADNWEVYTYNAKWVQESWEYWNVPVKSPIKTSKILNYRLGKLVNKAFKSLGCRDIARFDIRVDKYERPFIIDINVNPSLKYDELDATWISAHALHWSYPDLIESVVGVTYKRVYGKLPDRIRERQLLLTT